MPGKGDLSEESYLKKLGNMRADLEKIEFNVKEDLLATLREQFENGTFNPSQRMWDAAERLMGELYDVAKVWNPGGAVYKSYFIGAYREVKFCPDFKHNTFIDRLTKYLSEMRECAKSKDYIDLINSIYNKGLQRKNKVWLA